MTLWLALLNPSGTYTNGVLNTEDEPCLDAVQIVLLSWYPNIKPSREALTDWFCDPGIATNGRLRERLNKAQKMYAAEW
jgi:hypothetical protein